MKKASVCDWPKCLKESSHIKITNEDSAHYFLWHQGYCSLWNHYTRPDSQPNLLCGDTEAVTQSCAYKRAELWNSDRVLYHDHAQAHKTLSVKQLKLP